MPNLILTSGGATALAAHHAATRSPWSSGAQIKFGSGQYTPAVNASGLGTQSDLMTALSPAVEFNVSGVVSSTNTFTIGATDTGARVYDVGEVGVYDFNDVLIYIASQPSSEGHIASKVAGGQLVMSFDILLSGGTTTASYTFTTSFTFPDASTTTAGKVFAVTNLTSTAANAVPTAGTVNSQVSSLNSSIGGKADRSLANVLNNLSHTDRETLIRKIRPGVQNLTDSMNISWNVANGSIAKVSIGGNRTLAGFTNGQDGGYYELAVTASGGDRTLTLDGVYDTGSANAPAEIPQNETSLMMFKLQGTTRLFIGERAGYTL